MHRSNLGEIPFRGRSRHKHMAKKKGVKNLGFLEPRSGKASKTGKHRKAKRVYQK